MSLSGGLSCLVVFITAIETLRLMPSYPSYNLLYQLRSKSKYFRAQHNKKHGIEIGKESLSNDLRNQAFRRNKHH